MTTIQLPIRNFPAQQSIFDNPAQFKIAVKGRRFGLTKGAANDFIKEGIAGNFKQGLWVDTINANIDKYVSRYFLPHLKLLPEGLWQWRKQERILYIRDSYIDFRSADKPENIEGFAYDKAFLNEAGIILKDRYLWENSLVPMLSEFKPKVVIGGTPKGKNIFYELAQRALDPTQNIYAYFHFTSYDNPNLPKEVVDNMASSMSELTRQQEIWAEFLEDGGEVFRHYKEIMTAEPKDVMAGHYYVMGVDLAKVQDWTVITVYDRENNEQVYQDRFQTLEWPYQKKKITEICLKYNKALMYLDATGVGDPIADDLLRAGLPVEPIKITNELKKEMVEKLSIWIEQKKFRMISMKETLYEFDNFSYDISSSGRITYGAREGFHDDIVISHALAIWGLQPVIPIVPVREPTVIELAKLRDLRALKDDQNQYEPI